MKVKLYLSLIFLLSHQISIAHNSPINIRGTVRDAVTHSPLVNANISVKGTVYGTSSKKNGNFKLSGLYPGKYVVRASMMGYKSSKKTVIVKKDSIVSIHFRLHPTILIMDSVTVTGKRYRNVIADPSLESSGLELATSTITKREIRRQGAKTLIESIKYIPGALIETRGRKVKQFFSVRGQRYPYPDYAIDGAWQREFHEMPYFFSSANIERIEVIRSSAALLTGLSGMAGVINIIPQTYEQSQTSREIEYGSFGTYRAHLSHGAKMGSIVYTTGVGLLHTNGPKARHAAEGMANFHGSLHWYPFQKLNIKINLFHLNGKRDLALAEPPAAPRYQKELWSFEPYRATLTNIKAYYRPSQKVSTELLLYYTDRNPTHVKEDDVTHEITRISERDSEWGVNFIQSLSVTAENVLRFGGLYNHWIAPNGKRFYAGKRCDLETYSAVIVDEHRFGRLNLDAGLRWAKTYIGEYGAFNIQGTPKGLKKVTPVKDEWEPSVFQVNLGAAYDISMPFALHANMAVADIQPRRGTLDINFQDPKNEKRFKLDVGIRMSWKEIGQLSIASFYIQQKNAIVLSRQTAEREARIFELYLNRDQDQLGVEFETRFSRLFNCAEAFFNITAMAPRMEIGEKMVRNKELPQVIGNAGIYVQQSSLDVNILTKYVSAYESARFVASSENNPAQPQPLGNFLSVDMTIGWSVGETHRTRFYLEIQNLTDTKYSTVVGYPDYGRTLTLGVRQNFPTK